MRAARNKHAVAKTKHAMSYKHYTILHSKTYSHTLNLPASSFRFEYSTSLYFISEKEKLNNYVRNNQSNTLTTAAKCRV